MAAVQDAPPTRKGPSLVIQGVVLLVLTLMTAGLGWFAGNYLGQGVVHSGEPAAEAGGGHAEPVSGSGHGAAAEAPPAEGGHGGGDAAVGPRLVELAPMTTNLAAPDTVWVQLELSLLVDAPQPQDVIEAVHQDLFAYLRTVKLHQIEGASGYRHLKSDLEERARIRSDGHVQQVLVRTLIFE